jgi:menaquinone-dependent protoporphyrinogen oxidase
MDIHSIQDTEKTKSLRVLVTWGTKLGGTEGIAQTIGQELMRQGYDVTMANASAVRGVDQYNAIVIGGALYANRWHRDARRFISRHLKALRRIPVWMFSSGPLDSSADHGTIPPIEQVSVLMERVGARGHMTFGGRLAPNATGFPAAEMAKTRSGDFRNIEQIRSWAAEIGKELPSARPGVVRDHPAYSLSRLIFFGFVGAALLAAAMAALGEMPFVKTAMALHALAATSIYAVISNRYFRARGARDPLPTALAFVALYVTFSGVATRMIAGGSTMFGQFGWTWLPLVLVFATTVFVGFLRSTMPWPKAAEQTVKSYPEKRTKSA